MLLDLAKEPSGKFENFCRMSAEDFEHLLNKIGPNISKRDTNMRQAIPAKDRLAVTLRFLATGDSFTSLGYLFKISHQSISNIIPDVCKALTEALKEEIRVRKKHKLLIYAQIRTFILHLIIIIISIIIIINIFKIQKFEKRSLRGRCRGWRRG